MEIIIKRGKGSISVTVTGHTKTEYCNAVSCILWSLYAWGENYADDCRAELKSGDSSIYVKTDKEDIFDFVDVAIMQIQHNCPEIKIIKEGAA